jgi:hypothetical protein
MRQIEDRWRPNVKDLPNESEMYTNMITKYVYNRSQVEDIRSYSRHTLQNFISKKCLNICIRSKNIDYKTCFENCNLKLLQSDALMVSEKEKFDQKMKNFGNGVFLN